MQKAHLVIPSRALLHLRLNVKKEFVSNKLFFPLLYHPFNHNYQLTVSDLRFPFIPTFLAYISGTARANKPSYNGETTVDCGDGCRTTFGAVWKVGLLFSRKRPCRLHLFSLYSEWGHFFFISHNICLI